MYLWSTKVHYDLFMIVNLIGNGTALTNYVAIAGFNEIIIGVFVFKMMEIHLMKIQIKTKDMNEDTDYVHFTTNIKRVVNFVLSAQELNLFTLSSIK